MSSTPEELSAATKKVCAALEAAGEAVGANGLQSGLGALNGLTDGWALFLEAIEHVRKASGAKLDKEHRALLSELHAAAFEAVHRRKRRFWP